MSNINKWTQAPSHTRFSQISYVPYSVEMVVTCDILRFAVKSLELVESTRLS